MRSTVLLGAQLFTSALTGYAFQKIFAYYYGASIEKSIFDIAFALPQMLIYLSGFGMTHAIVVSLFTRLRDDNRVDRNAVFSSLLNVSLLLLICITLATALFAGQLSAWLAPGFADAGRAATRHLILCMLPLALTFGVSSYLSAIAIAWRIALGQEILLLLARIVVIVYIMTKRQAVPLQQVATLLIAVTAVALAVQWTVVLRITKLRYKLVLNVKDPAVIEAIHQFSGFAIVALMAQIATAYWRRMGTLAGPDVVALLGFGFSIVDTLGAILGKVIAFHFGQPLAAAVSASHPAQGFGWILRRLAVLAIPVAIAAALIAVMAPSIVHVLFGGGAFGTEAAVETAGYLRVMTIGLPGVIIFYAALYPLLAMGRHSAALAYTLGYVTQILLLWALFGSFSGMTIPLSYACCVWVQAIAGVALLNSKLSARAGVAA